MPGTQQESTVTEIVAAADLGDAARQQFHAEVSAPAFVEQLSAAGLFPDAVKFLAGMLGAKRSVIWATACVRELQNGNEPPAQRAAALEAVNKWLQEGTDETRRAAKTAAEVAGLKSAEGCIGMAAFFAEGSMAPAHVQSIPPTPHVAEKLSAAAVLLSVVSQPQHAPERFARCLTLGVKDVNP